jgi:hypothetical protein
MVVITVWKWKDIDEKVMTQAMGATAVLDTPEGYQNYLFLDGSGGVSIAPDGETPESAAQRAWTFSKFCTLDSRSAMTQEEALGIAPKVVELLTNLAED